jgi:hypothetical protein
MNTRNVLLGFCAALALSTGARAGVIADYSNFCDTTGLTLVGNATTTSGPNCALQLTSASGGESGAGYSTTAVTLGAGDTFSSTFQFQITDPGGIDPADGIVFVLSAGSAGLGGSGLGIGYAGVGNSVGIEFDTYDNGDADGDSSNHIAIDEDGNVTDGNSESDQDLVNVYGVQTCDFTGSPSTYLSPGCMSNGDVWSVTISYDGSNLSLTASDPAESSADMVYTSLPIDIGSFIGGSTAYVGFTSGTGLGYDNQDILSWQFANDTSLAAPEPASFSLAGLALAGLGLAALRRLQKWTPNSTSA